MLRSDKWLACVRWKCCLSRSQYPLKSSTDQNCTKTEAPNIEASGAVFVEIVNVSIGCALIKMECISYTIMMLRGCRIMGGEGVKRGCRKSSRETTLLNFISHEYHPPYAMHSNKKVFLIPKLWNTTKILARNTKGLWVTTTWYF